MIGCAAAVALLTGCDEGRIYPSESVDFQQGRSARLKGHLTGLSTWSRADCHVALAAFTANGAYAEVSHNIQAAAQGDSVDVVLTGIADEVATIRICAIDNLRKQVAEFATYEMAGYDMRDTIRIDAGSLDVSMTAAVQRRVFNTTCIACHGGSNHPAAGLNLTEGRSLSQLAGIRSTVAPDSVRIVPGHPEKSLLYHALSSDMSRTWAYDHSVEVIGPSVFNMIKQWIESLDE